MGAISLEYFRGNMDCQKYASLFENSVNKIKKILQKWRLKWDNDNKHKSNASLNLLFKEKYKK